MNNHFYTIANGVTGVTASLAAVSTTFLTQYELWVRSIGGTLAIIVALITIYNLLKPKNRP